MKKKKGFTLVEILGVITILGVLALIAIPTIDNIVTKNREKLYDSQIKTIEDGLKTWGNANAISLPEEGDDAILLSLGILKLAGFVDEDIKNPNTNLCFSNDMLLSISPVKEGYTYYVDEESGVDGTEEDCSAPTATEFLYLKGNSNLTLDLNDTYEEPGYVALDATGNVISGGLVTTQIKDKNGSTVSSIDTTEATAAPYTITYTYGSVVKTRTVNVSIGDPIGTNYLFDYTGSVQTATLKSGTYKLEVWGAEGGKGADSGSGTVADGGAGGLGGYSYGTLNISADTSIYIYVGGKGVNVSSAAGGAGGFNGGGNGILSGTISRSGGGGGGTDIRIATDSLYARVIVAGGGGGTTWNSSYVGGYGGGTTGGTGGTAGSTGGTGGTQTAGGTNGNPGTFGIGANGGSLGSTYNASGTGGGGWYGGGSGNLNCSSGSMANGGGGSSYVYTSTTATNYPAGCLLNSSYYLTDAATIAGNASMPTHDGASTMTGNSGNGYVKITKIG